MDDLNINDFKAVPGDFPAPDKPKRQARPKSRQKFIRGPLPLSWWTSAMRLPASAIRTALVLWYKSGLAKSRTVKPTGADLEQFHLTRDATTRGLKALEDAGLVAVDRHPGRRPVVTVLDVAENETEESAQ